MYNNIVLAKIINRLSMKSLPNNHIEVKGIPISNKMFRTDFILNFKLTLLWVESNTAALSFNLNLKSL